jgi:membrane protease YdiL (CAAX protease family)
LHDRGWFVSPAPLYNHAVTSTPPPINFVHSYEAPQSPAPRPPRGPLLGTVVAWLVILGCAAVLMVRPRWVEHATGSPTTQPAAAAALPSVAKVRSPQVELLGRYAVGTKALAADKSLPADQLIQKVDAAATSPIDEFRAIAVTGELAGDRAALKRLDEFERQHHVVRLRADVDALRQLYTAGPHSLPEHQRQLLVTNHHWFGQLALSYGLPPKDPARTAAIGPAVRSVFAMAAAAFLGFGALFTGLVLLILGIVLLVKGRLTRAYHPPAVPLAGPLVEAFAIYLFLMVFGSQVLVRLFPRAGIELNFPLLLLLPLTMLYLRIRGLAWGDVGRTLGWVRGRGFWREVGVGLVGYLAGLPVLALGAAITFVLVQTTGKTASHPIADQPLDRARDVVAIVLLACVMAPLLEETMFRGALFSHLRARLGWWVSAPIVSLIFAAIHPQGWVAIPVLGAIAMVLAALREWRGSSVASMTAHALNNGVAVLMMILMLR